MITSPEGQTLEELEAELIDLDIVNKFKSEKESPFGWPEIYKQYREELLEKIKKLKVIQIYE